MSQLLTKNYILIWQRNSSNISLQRCHSHTTEIASHNVEPSLNIIFVYKVSRVFSFLIITKAGSFCFEENIQIKFIKFSLISYVFCNIIDLICKHSNSRHHSIWIRSVFIIPIFFCFLFITIGPRKNLVFYEFSHIECTKRRARKE